jgi:hypothetical protein
MTRRAKASWAGRFALAVLWTAAGPASADTARARCTFKPSGAAKAVKSQPCAFSQRQGHVTITFNDGRVFDLSPSGDAPGVYQDVSGRRAYRRSGLGKAGLRFQTADGVVDVSW